MPLSSTISSIAPHPSTFTSASISDSAFLNRPFLVYFHVVLPICS